MLPNAAESLPWGSPPLTPFHTLPSPSRSFQKAPNHPRLENNSTQCPRSQEQSHYTPTT